MDRRDYAYDARDEARAAMVPTDREDTQPDLRDLPLDQPGDSQWAYRQTRRGGAR